MLVMIFLKALYSLKFHPSQQGAKKNTPHDVAIYLARELSGESGVDLGKYFGNLCGASVTVGYKHISERIGSNRRLKSRVNRVKNRIVNN